MFTFLAGKAYYWWIVSQIQTISAGSMRPETSVGFWLLLPPSAYQFLFLAHSRCPVTVLNEWPDYVQFHQDKLQWRTNTWIFLIEFLLSLLRRNHLSHAKCTMIIQSLLPTTLFLRAFPKGGRWVSYYRSPVLVRTPGLSQVSTKWLNNHGQVMQLLWGIINSSLK